MGLILRPARFSDAEQLFLWRVEDEQLGHFHGALTGYEDHKAWFLPRVNSGVMDIWIAEEDGIRVGQVRMDSNGEITHSVDKNRRGEGIGTQIILAACALHKGRVKACVDATNVSGRRVMEKTGFEYRPDVKFYLRREP